MVAPRSLIALAVPTALVVVGCAAKTGGLPPHGEALVIVDTDLPVPQIASRLRVDLYTEDGIWFESRDIGRSDPRDWPASFSVFSDDDTRERRVLVRLRAYPEGITRDYVGERYEPRQSYTPPKIATSLDELCKSAPELAINGHLTLRAGAQKLTDVVASPQCPQPAESGSIAARVTIPARGRYHFFVSNAFSYNTYASLSLRGSCDEPSSQIVCQSEPRGQTVFTPEHFPRFDVDLDPGTYTLLTTGEVHSWAADITVDVTLADSVANPPAQTKPVTLDTPFLEDPTRTHGGALAVDVTPRSEPLPSASVDRLLALRLVPGVRGSARVMLRGACAGTMARLGVDPHRPDPSTAETCIDTEGVRTKTEDTPLDPDLTRPGATAVGTFGRGEECPAGAGPNDPFVCVPGGVFLFGSRLVTESTSTPADAAPERIAVMRRYWMDRDEVTKKRLRDAIGLGLSVDSRDIFEKDVTQGTNPFNSFCAWTKGPSAQEDAGVSCLNWSLARAFCQSRGGDLPTEAEWEYAATAAGRASKTLYPWGDKPETCAGVVMGRDALPGGPRFCLGPTQSAGPATSVTEGPADLTPQGIHGLGGNLAEWTLDSGQAFTHPCWSAASLVSPRCLEPDAPMHVIRGGSWQSGSTNASTRVLLPTGIAAHGIAGTASATPAVGFRCAYGERPK